MPRRDGLPTNQEMLGEFTAKSHEVYRAAFELQLQGDMVPALEGKPLWCLGLNITQVHPHSEIGGVREEKLVINPLDLITAQGLSEHLQYRDRPNFIRQRYRRAARQISRLVLDNELVFADKVPSVGTKATYTATMEDNTHREVGTFSPAPAKQTIAAGKYFAEEALQYVNSEDFLLKPEERQETAVRLVHGGVYRDHYFYFNIWHGLPLNGHEPESFLLKYHNMYLERSMHEEATLAQLLADKQPKEVIDLHKERMRLYDAAVDRARSAILKNAA